MDWQHLLEGIAIAIFSGVVSGLVAYGGISVKLDWLRSDINSAASEARAAMALAQEAIRVAERALIIADRRKEPGSGEEKKD